GTLSNRASKL
nr:Chain B, 10-SKL PTS1 peptide Ac-GTLSNRASKL [synthetic construct]